MNKTIGILARVDAGKTTFAEQLLRKHRIPTLFFINKTDRIGADIASVLKEFSRGNLMH